MRQIPWPAFRKSSHKALRILLIAVLVATISAFHFGTGTEHRYLHEIYQRTYYIPILLAAFWYGAVPGVGVALMVSAIYLVHIRLDWHHAPVYTFNQYAEIFLYNVIALIIGLLSSKQEHQRRRLEATSRELSEAYSRLQSTFEQLRRADRMAALGELSAGIAHEIRNPLGSIKGSVEILESEFPPPHPKREFVDIIKEETARLNRIVNEVLKFARPPTPIVELASLPEIIESTMTLVGKEVRDSGIETFLDLDRSMPRGKVDPDQIRQVLLNVVLNAIQAMPEGGKLRMACGHNDDTAQAWIEVADSGEGLDQDSLEHIFDPFFTTKPTGTGLGLSICFQLVQNHGGTISAERNEWGGLSMRITLPWASSAPAHLARG